jgi:hypothetical protein
MPQNLKKLQQSGSGGVSVLALEDQKFKKNPKSM